MSSVTQNVGTFQLDPAIYPHSSTYAASMVVGPDNIIYYTGLTYETSNSTPRCFLATSSFTTSSFSESTTFSEATPSGDACRAIGLIGTDQLALAGTTDPQGRLNYAADRTESDLPLQGFAMTLDAFGETLKGVTLSSSTRVPYPQAVVGDPEDPNALFVASMTANQDVGEDPLDELFPNWTREFQHGTTFELTVEKFFPQDDSITPARTQYFPVDPNADGGYDQTTTVHVAGMIKKPGVGLIIAGSTAATGEAYGTNIDNNVQGFVTILDPTTGKYGNANKDGEAQAFQRFGSELLDIVTNICDDPYDVDAFYVVGATMGDMGGHIKDDIVSPPSGSMYAFIRKVQASSLEEEWTVQFGAYLNNMTSTVAEALGCAVNENGSVYVVGQVESGAGMIELNTMQQSEGGKDIWIARVNTTSGHRLWI